MRTTVPVIPKARYGYVSGLILLILGAGTLIFGVIRLISNAV